MKIGDIEVLTISEAAERLSLDRTTLFRQIQAGVMVAEKTGSVWLIEAEEVERYREQHKGRHGFASPRHTGRHGRKPKDA